MQTDQFQQQEQQEQREFEQKAEAISQHILSSRNQFIEKPIEKLDPEELGSLVEDGFDEYALNYIIAGNFDRYIEYERIYLTLKTKRPVRRIEEVQKILERQLERYIEDLKRDCEKYKAKIYENIRAYQDAEKRKKEGNPFSN